MPKLFKFLWLLAPSTIVVTAWCVTARMAEGAAGANADFLLVAGSLLVAFVVSYAGFAHTNRSDAKTSRPHRQRTDLLRIVQSLPLSKQASIHALQFDSRLILIGSCGGKLTRLDHPSDSRRADSDADGQEPEFSEEGIDLRDTPGTTEETVAKPRNLSEAKRANSVSRSALNAANLADFRSKLEQARADA